MSRTWVARILIGIVTAWNLQAAVMFMLFPERFIHAYELSGVPGIAAVRGVGVLFLMWNIPYLVALWDPDRFRLALVISLCMQFTGLLGESFISLSLPPGHGVLHTSIQRFILFDGVGVLMLVASIRLIKKTAAEKRPL